MSLLIHTYNKSAPTHRFNAKDPEYGAAGDGVTNDNAAIQAAIDAANAEYVATGVVQTVWFPSGDYLTPATNGPATWVANAGIVRWYALSLKSGVELQSDGTAILRCPYNSSGTADGSGFAAETHIVIGTGGNGDDWAIQGLRFTQEYSSGTERSTSTVLAGTCRRFSICDNVFDGLAGQMIALAPDSGSSTPVQDFHIDRNRGTAICGQFVTMYGRSGVNTREFTINDNYLVDALSAAESIAGADSYFQDGEVCDNFVRNYGPITIGGDRLHIDRNHLFSYGISGGGIGLHGGTDLWVTDNVVDMSTATAAAGAAAQGNVYMCIDATTDSVNGAHIVGNHLIAGYSPAFITQATGGHSNWWITDNLIESADPSMVGDGLLQLRSIEGFHLNGNTIDGHGANRTNLYLAGSTQNGEIRGNHWLDTGTVDSSITSAVGCVVADNVGAGYLVVFGDSKVHDNDFSRPNTTLTVIEVGTSAQRVFIHSNTLRALGSGSKTIVSCNTGTDYIWVFDNMPVLDTGTLSGGSSDGISLVGTNSKKRVP